MFRTGIIFIHAHPQVVHCNSVVSSLSAHLFRRSCAYKTFGQTDWLSRKTVWEG